MNDFPSGGVTREYAAGKMLAAKDDGVGLITFNQPEKRNAMSLEMWTGLGEILDEFAEDGSVRVVILTGAGHKAFVSGADISQFEKNRSNAECAAGVRPAGRRGAGEVRRVPQAGHRAHSRLLPGRRAGDRDAGRSADCRGGQRVRHSGGEAFDRVCAGFGEAADRSGGAGACADDPVHRAADRRGGGAADRADQQDGRGRGTERRGAGYRADDRRQRAAVGGGVEADDQRDAEGREPAGYGGDASGCRRCASTARTTRRGGRRSWRSGRRGGLGR